MTLVWMFSFANVAFVGLLFLVFYVYVLRATIRHHAKTIACPADRRARKVVFEGRSIDPEHWGRVCSCGDPGAEPLSGSALRCSMICLLDPRNCPGRDLRK